MKKHIKEIGFIDSIQVKKQMKVMSFIKSSQETYGRTPNIVVFIE